MKLRTTVSTLIPMLAWAACGGGGSDDVVTVVDAAVDAATDARIDAPPPVCSAPMMMCGAECVDVISNEQFCGNCMTACSGGQVCDNRVCGCADITIPANPSFLMPMVRDDLLPGATLGIGPYFGATLDLLVMAHATQGTMLNSPYTLTGMNLGTPPFAAFGYDVDLGTQTPSAAYYATAGTLTFTKICLADAMTGQMPGFTARLENAVFQAVDSIMNPVLVPNGCRIPKMAPNTLPTITFSIGNVTCQ